MSKVLKPILAIGLTIGATLLLPGLGSAIAGALSTSLMVGSAIAAVGLTVGVSLLSNVLGLNAKPKVPSEARNRLFATLDPNAPRKIVFGETALATDVRYQAYTGTDQEYHHWIMCVAAHEVEAIEEIWFDSELAWSAASGIASKYAGYLTITTRLVGTSGNGITIDSIWTSACTLTGCAYFHARFKLTGNDKKAESPFASSIPTRVTVRGKGAKVPDPRYSTAEGGSGSQSMPDQTTWAYTTASDSGRNPACQLLFYLLGWKIGGKLSVGRGMPADRIDFASFIAGANLCDETVTLAAGGTEPRYRADGVFSEGDDPGTVTGNLLSAMNAVLRDDGGRISLHVLHNDLSDPDALELSEDDILGDESWKQTPSIEQTFNIVRGRYTDPSNAALYQLAEAPEVELTSFDGIDRIDSFDQATVQSGSQWQRLAKQRLERNQYQGTYSATFNARAWGTSIGRIVLLSHAALGWAAKPFRVMGQGIRMDGGVPLVLQEENAAIYAWDAEEAAPVSAAVPTVYDPTLDPIVVAIGDAAIADDLGDLAEQDNVDFGTQIQNLPDPIDPANLTPGGKIDAGEVQYGAGGPLVMALQPAEAGATLGATWNANLTSRPANLAALTGSEGVNNGLVSISAGGALAGAGGGQVTPAGLETASGLTIRNNALTISAGALNGIGTGNGTLVANSSISITSGSLNGIGTGSGTAVANSLVSIGSNGLLSGAGGGQVTLSGVGFTGDTDAQRNSRLTIGADTGGTGGRVRTILLNDGTNLSLLQLPASAQNLDITISGTAISGIGSGTGTAIANAGVSIGSNGALAGGGGGQVTIGGLAPKLDPLATAGRNKIVNGGAESGNVDPWKIDTTYLAIVAGTPPGNGLYIDATVRHSGTSSFVIGKTSGSQIGPVIHPAMSVVPGRKYLLRLAMWCVSGAQASGLFLNMLEKATAPGTGYVDFGLIDSYTQLLGDAPQSNPVQLYEFQYVAPAGIYWVSPMINAYAGSAHLIFDSVEFYELTDYELGSDVTLTAAPFVMPPASTTVQADNGGTIAGGTFNKDGGVVSVTRNGANINATCSYSATFTNCTGSVDNSSDKGRITWTGMTAGLDIAYVDVTVTLGGVSLGTYRVYLVKNRAAATIGSPPTGGTGNAPLSDSDTIDSSVTSTTDVVVAGPFSVRAGAGGKINAEVAVDVDIQGFTAGSVTETFYVYYRAEGSGSYVLFGSGHAASVSRAGGDNFPASLGFSELITGLTAGNDYEIELVAHVSAARGVFNSGSFTGTAQ